MLTIDSKRSAAVPFCSEISADYCQKNAARINDICHQLGKSAGSLLLVMVNDRVCCCVCGAGAKKAADAVNKLSPVIVVT